MYSVNEALFFMFKIFLIGKKGVGISTFIKSLELRSFFDTNIKLTVGADIFKYDYPIKSGNKNGFIKFNIWVHNPEPRFKRILRSYIAHSDAILIMFDVSDLSSLNEIDNWMEVIRTHKYISKNVPIMLLGNKSDLLGYLKPAKALADSIVKKFGLVGYYEISALKSKNIKPTLKAMAEAILKKRFPNLVKSL